MKKTVVVLTATRAEYGLLKPIISKLDQDEKIDLKIAVTGMHLSPDFGLTYQEIEQDGFLIDKKIEILTKLDDPTYVTKAMGTALIGFGEYFHELKPDLLLVLGDRYETLAVCCAAMTENIPIAHLYGGETTEGAIDESVRHAVTKMSFLHFTSTEEYRKRVIQLGESPERVFTVGGIGIENILNMNLLSEQELRQSIGVDIQKQYAVVTFHPATLDKDSAKEQFKHLLMALEKHNEYDYVITKSNADSQGSSINKMIDEYAATHPNVKAFYSLGSLRYLSALKYTSMVIGNSSSGLLEAPSFGIPTINIGDRQKGRIQSDSVINCIPEEAAISAAIDKAATYDFKDTAKNTINPYGDGNTSNRVITVMKKYLFDGDINLKKKFFDITFEE